MRAWVKSRVFTLGRYLSIEWIRKMHRKIHKVNDVAAAGTIDILKEMTTVRQFAMEKKEHKRYSVTNLFRRILERRLATGTGSRSLVLFCVDLPARPKLQYHSCVLN